ncbi:MAG: HAD-IC family P-type ATPase [Anaerolineaceae bacterium]|nr:HAD-IC family P-type ATPase [Anaerolineaceae bacterium]
MDAAIATTESPPPGLTAAEVAERREQGRDNRFQARVGRTYWRIFTDNILNLFNIVLFSLLLIVVLFGDYSTALFAGFSVVTNSFLGMLQEMRAKRKLDQLAALSARKVLVWRGGELLRLPAEEVVEDDWLEIYPGERIAVDGICLHSDALEMDESQLTGESDAVHKLPDDELHSGSFCLAGSGRMRATRVGKDSSINQLTAVAKIFKRTLTPTQQTILAFVQITTLLMLVLGPMIMLASTLDQQSLLQTIRNAVVFVTSLVPQGLVLVSILSLSIGAIKISRQRTLVQQVNAVETMANVTVLCFDKTGTMTQNQLAIQEIRPGPGQDHSAVTASLATYIDRLAHRNGTAEAIHRYLASQRIGPAALGDKVEEIPFSSVRKWGAIQFAETTLLLGAPERFPFPTTEVAQLKKEVAALSAQGLRVLAFAQTSDPPSPHSAALESTCELLALLTLSDTMREDISETLHEFGEQNVSLKVISGDNLLTVRAIAEKAGLCGGIAYEGAALDALSDAELANAVQQGQLFARVDPGTKRRILQVLKQQGEFTAMVGDGVNDVPALKEAHLAVVLNDGAQISKDVADIVLLNNDLTTLPRAFHEGRTITQTILGTMKLFLVKTCYSILGFFFVMLMSLPFPVTPVQISWVTFGVVNIPATLIAFRILLPAAIRNYRRDLIDFAFTFGFLGAVGFSLLYASAYLSSPASALQYAEASSAAAILITLFGMLAFWHVHGLDPFLKSSWAGRTGLFLLGIVLAAFTIAAFYVVPDTLEFAPPPPTILTLIAAIFSAVAALTSLSLRNRHMMDRLWIFLGSSRLSR